MIVAQKKDFFPVVNRYNCIKNPQVTGEIPVLEWLNLVKESEYKDKILKARNYVLDYNSTKSSLPCVTFNFLYSEYKIDENIVSGTGLLYFDIDHSDFDIDNLDRNKVFSYFRSFGGKGYSIIVRVQNLTKLNFKKTYLKISKEIGIYDFIDHNASKPSQFNVLSYDPNIFINMGAELLIASIEEDAPPSIVLKKRERERAFTSDGGANFKMRFTSLDYGTIKGQYLVNWEGIEHYLCFMPMRKLNTGRNNFLLAYCTNLISLNPELSKENALSILEKVNNHSCVEPFDRKRLMGIVNSVFKYHLQGTLQPKYSPKPRKIVFSKHCTLSKDEKLRICRIEIAKKKCEDSKVKLLSIVSQWDFDKYGNITQRKVYNTFPISKKTVEKYWPNFKDFIIDQNKSNENNGYISLYPSEFEIPENDKLKLRNKISRFYETYGNSGVIIKLIFVA